MARALQSPLRPGSTPSSLLADIITCGEGSRTELADRLGVSKASIGRAVEQLIRSGLVEEGARYRASERGRSATAIVARAELGYAIGADLEGSAARACLFDCQRNVVASRYHAIDPTWTPKRIGAQWRRLIDEVVESAGVPRDRIIALGLAVPGVGAPGAEEMRTTLSHGLLTRLDVRELLGDFDLPVVASDNTLCVSDYERRFGVASDVASFVSVLVRYGIGAAICSRDRFVSGEEALCSELGHVSVRGGSKPCVCGSRGCLDTTASGRSWPSVEQRRGASWEAELVQRARDLGSGLASLLKIVPLPVVVLNGIYNPYSEIVEPVFLEVLEAELGPLGLPVPSLRFGDDVESKASLGAGLRALGHCLEDYLEADGVGRRSA